VEPIPVCEKCGLKIVRRELEKNGIVLKFCDYCYWGEAATPESPAWPDVPGERVSEIEHAG